MKDDPRREILSLLATFEPRDDEERFSLEMLCRFVTTHTNVLHRANLQGHLTASAFLVDPARTRFLLVQHKKLGKWLQPGGHADGEADLYQVAAREAREETGLRSLLGERRVFDVDVHTIPASATVPAHLHYDVRFLFVADPQEPLRPRLEECLAAAWRPRGEVADLDGSVVRMVEKALRSPTAAVQSDHVREKPAGGRMSPPQLTDLSTVGESTARQLSEHGFAAVADLAAATIEQIGAVPGFGDTRSAVVREAAVRLLEEHAGESTGDRDDAPAFVTPWSVKKAKKKDKPPKDKKRKDKKMGKKKDDDKKKDKKKADKKKVDKKKDKKVDKKKADKKKADKKKNKKKAGKKK